MKNVQSLIIEWLDAQVRSFQQAIAQRKSDYLRKKWAWNEKAVSDFNRRIDELSAIHASVLTELSVGRAHGDNLLHLANIVFNEAGASSQKAKVAIAYAWLNRTRGVMREPKSAAEVSHYISLLERWNGLNDIQRLTFLSNFTQCLSAARQRLADGVPSKNDSTQGATHWVSPISLDPFKNQDGRYARSVGKAHNRAFPTWARGNNDAAVAKMKQLSQVKPNYTELTVAGIDSSEFLFYVGVNY